jgi:thermolysin
MARRRVFPLALALAIPTSLAVAAPPAHPAALSLTRIESTGLRILDERFLSHEQPDTDLTVTRVTLDDLKMGHTRVQQTFAGVPVFGGEAIVHLNRDGSLFTITDSLIHDVDVDVHPTITADEAADLAVLEDQRPGEYTAPPRVDLQIFARDGQSHLAWRVRLTQEDGTPDTALPVFFIDAHSGDVLFRYDNLQTVQGTGASLYSGTVPTETYYKSPSYYLEDISRKIGTFDNRNTTGSTYRFTDSNNVWDSSSQKAAVDAHLGARMVYEYYQNVHGRNGIDGNGGPGYYTSVDGKTKLISSKVHYGWNYNNAFWNGSYMTYGDGDGKTFSPLVSVDIAGHEMTHGVTEKTAGLIYSGESGALNESMSDIFGTCVEFYTYSSGANYQIGEDAYTPGKSGDALRYMDDPHKDPNYGYTADDDPDHYSERYTGSSDNGGVHINSGISNKVFYLLAQGGTHHMGGSMTGIGIDKAANIWYRALTGYMTSSTTFAGARNATLNAAAVQYGSTSAEYDAVAQAWSLCGVN